LALRFDLYSPKAPTFDISSKTQEQFLPKSNQTHSFFNKEALGMDIPKTQQEMRVGEAYFKKLFSRKNQASVL